MEQRIEKWRRWIERIREQVTVLMMYRWFNDQYVQIVNANPKLRPGSPFLDYFRAVYGDYAAMAVRRQVRRHADSISLAGLLEELSENPTFISRSWTRALYSQPTPTAHTYDPEMAQWLADSTYSQFAGASGEHLSVEALKADMKELAAATAVVVQFSDRAIAHDDKGGVRLDAPPTFHDLDGAILALEKITRKYVLLITGANFPGFTPVDQTDAMSVFRFPWIQGEE